MTWQEYEADLERRLIDLHGRIHRGAYRPQPSRRTYIPKTDGQQRPLAIAALEDKIAQGATVMVLNAIYEEDFLGFSYGFRPRRGAHDALDALAVGIAKRKVNYILDADIRSFFNSVSWEWLVRFVEHRIGDKRIIRLIQKWLRAGILEDGAVTVSDRGTGQGSVASPLLANIYLHYVFDLWAERWRRREATGDMIVVRYADDVVLGFQHENDARRFLDAMRARFEEFALQLHPDKTRLIEFGRYAAATAQGAGLVNRKLSLSWGSPISAAAAAGANLCSSGNPAGPRPAQAQGNQTGAVAANALADPRTGRWLAKVTRGFFAYHAVPTDSAALGSSGIRSTGIWLRTLRRRSETDDTPWTQMEKLAEDFPPETENPSSKALHQLVSLRR